MKVTPKATLSIDKLEVKRFTDVSKNEYLEYGKIYEVIGTDLYDEKQDIFTLDFTIIYNKYEFWSFSSNIFDIVFEDIDDDWIFRQTGTGYTFSPMCINYDDFWEDFVDDNKDARKMLYRRFIGKITPIDLSSEDAHKKYFYDYQNPNISLIGVSLGLHDGNFWIQCPKCFNAMQADKSCGVMTCDEPTCQTIFNNPWAKTIKQDNLFM